jgi:hypothetical protein
VMAAMAVVAAVLLRERNAGEVPASAAPATA